MYLSFILQAQQLTDLERKLAVAKNELEKAALDRVSWHPWAIRLWLQKMKLGVLIAALDLSMQFQMLCM